MKSIFNLPPTIEDDINKFKEETERFKNGSISPTEFRSFRVTNGIYEQRERGIYMLRVRFTAGIVLPEHMRALASVSRKYGNGVLHVTTRQDIQVHSVELDNIYPALLELYDAGLSPKGGGGNTVRNIASCYDAGVCEKEVFDVTPYSIALSEFLLADPLSFRLPRKYKIAFSGCSGDCAGATINDVGFIARKRGEELGFAVYAGGGMGAQSRVAELLEEFVPANDIHFTAEAVKRIFDRHGNRKNKNKARLRFLIEQIGFNRFKDLYKAELSELRHEGLPSLNIRDITNNGHPIPEIGEQSLEGFDEWCDRNTVSQRQKGYYLVQIPLKLGDIPADVLGNLADVIEKHGERMVRTTPRQNLVIRWIHENELAELYNELMELNLAGNIAQILSNTVSCAGASTCQLGICLSRGLACAVTNELERSELDLDRFGDFNINISGCPNSCGRHRIGDIGMYGAARRIDGRLAPHYIVQIGGKVTEGKTRLAEGNAAIPAKNVPAFIADFMRAFQESPQFPDYDTFIESEGWKIHEKLITKHKRIPSFEEDKNYYFDWGAGTLFTLEGRGAGECSAGVFDLIQVDLSSAEEALREGKLLTATFLAARSLLITQGQEAKNNIHALELFTKYFIDTGFVDDSFGRLIENARQSLFLSRSEETFIADIEEVSAFFEAVKNLYDQLDQSLRLTPVKSEETTPSEISQSVQIPGKEQTIPGELKIDNKADFHDVACPLNYVKTKLLLEQMKSDQVLEVILNDEGVGNVPASAEQDGYKVLSEKKEGKYWRVLIKKGQG